MSRSHSFVGLFTLVALTCLGRAEPVQDAVNEFGLWHRAEPGRFKPLNEPAYLAAKDAQLAANAEIIGVCVDEDARAFPLRLMAYHHVTNDMIGGRRLSVTYCIMANTAVCYELPREQAGLEAGGLFGGVLAMREQGTDKCWPQIARVLLPEDEPTTEPLSLGPPAIITTWGKWRAAHPATSVLAPVAEFEMRYEAFDRSSRDFRPNPLMNTSITHIDDRLDPGVEVFGLAWNGASWASPLDRLREVGSMNVEVGGEPVAVVWDEALDTPRTDAAFPGFAMRSYWYAWAQFYPGSEVAP